MVPLQVRGLLRLAGLVTTGAVVMFAAACSSSLADPVPTKASSAPTTSDTSATEPSEATAEEASETPAPNDGGGVQEASITVADASYKTGMTVDGGANACGMCDREWVCNNYKQLWLSESDGRCVNQTNHTALRCDGTLDGTGAKNVGTWIGNDEELQLRFDSFGSTHIIYCVPPT
ncbi:hypothetical protein AKJ09_00984 [Labilithrix luteola]|uniref:Lipoprotein n=1 Tax=Labilithrix luteola TaxID=1391654 RepID=A0A0K1PLC3_9BACT|nr:hypothetical protein [Labilithrix luteola]AKU94320.1 hypothetical protein AKJ09_00984 [Labilithrix luteola]